jgi:hypothetical protein
VLVALVDVALPAGLAPLASEFLLADLAADATASLLLLLLLWSLLSQSIPPPCSAIASLRSRCLREDNLQEIREISTSWM